MKDPNEGPKALQDLFHIPATKKTRMPNKKPKERLVEAKFRPEFVPHVQAAIDHAKSHLDSEEPADANAIEVLDIVKEAISNAYVRWMRG